MKNHLLPDTFDALRKKVAILGLGFVGAAMAAAVSNASKRNIPIYDVIGIDRPTELGKKRVDSINNGIFPFETTDIELKNAISKAHEYGNIYCATSHLLIAEADYIVVDINLDIQYQNDGTPYLDLSAFKEAVSSIGENMKPDALIVVETTVPPGTCEKVVLPLIDKEFKKRGINSTPNIAHSYERVMPGKQYYNSIINFWRVYSGINKASADLCEKFLRSFIHTDNFPLTRLKTTTASETAKVLENSYRAANIAFMEEWGRFAEQVGIDIFEVINAIRMRPTHSNIRQPGFGVGGYCLTKDPYFAKLAAKDLFGLNNLDFPFCTKAVSLNKKMPLVTLDALEKALGGLAGRKILVLGVSYRQDVGDTRYSPTEIFALKAISSGAELVFHDPLVTFWPELKTEVIQTYPEPKEFDTLLFTVGHKAYQDIDIPKWLNGAKPLIFDANNVLTEKQIATIQAYGCPLKMIGRG